MTQQNLYEWLTHPESLNRETLYELRTLLARYPYFQTARLLYLKNLFLLHDITFGEELRRAALYIADRSVLFHLIEGDRFKIVPFPEKKEAEEGKEGLDRTLSLIDAFLSTVPREEAPALHLPAANVATDYASYLLREEEQKTVVADSAIDNYNMKGQDLIDEFIEKAEEEPFSVSLDVKKTEQPVEVEETDEQPETHEEEEYDESYFTETLAKIYVKQRRYSKALEIIKKLNLKYPKKNAYFADQIRFLEKLIINTKSK
ncbi:MAG: tetratricopeptide repeat protein [Bacteroidales bacterium]|nr:tetratricopeptide repeat protein [Bacteroidales bacterium]